MANFRNHLKSYTKITSTLREVNQEIEKLPSANSFKVTALRIKEAMLTLDGLRENVNFAIHKKLEIISLRHK